MKKNIKSFVTAFLFITTSLFFVGSNVFAQTLDKQEVVSKASINNLSTNEKKELIKAFNQQNIDDAIKKFDFNKSGKQTVKLSDNYLLNCTVTSDDSLLVNRNIVASGTITPLATSSTTKTVHISASSAIGLTLWDLYVGGTFNYNGSTVSPVTSYVSAQAYAGWTASNSYSHNISVTSTQAKAYGGATFSLIIAGVTLQSYNPVIAVGSNQYGQTIQYSN